MTDVMQGFPGDLLVASKEERLEYWRGKLIAHPNIKRARQQVDSVVRSRAGKQIALVVGPTGVGKTTLLTAISRGMWNDDRARIEADTGYVPEVHVSLPSPESGDFSWRDFYLRVLEAADEPMIDRKAIYAHEGADDKPRNRKTYNRRDTIPTLRMAVESCFRYRHVRALLLDEGQHLLKMASGRRLIDQMDVLKSLSDATGTAVILFGTYQMLDFMALNDQLLRRSQYVEFPRYVTDVRGLSDFRITLENLQRYLPLARQQVLADRVSYLYDGSLGCIGLLKDWLTRALIIAMDDNAESITDELLAHCREPQGVLIELARIMAKGELDLHSRLLGAKEDATLASLLSISASSQGTPKHRPAAAPRTDAGGRRPGSRKPGRDRVGADSKSTELTVTGALS